MKEAVRALVAATGGWSASRISSRAFRSASVSGRSTKASAARSTTLFETARDCAARHRAAQDADEADVDVLDAAYWVKGCSSLGRLRYAVLLDIDGGAVEGDDLCLIDIKEAVKAAAPRYTEQM